MAVQLTSTIKGVNVADRHEVEPDEKVDLRLRELKRRFFAGVSDPWELPVGYHSPMFWEIEDPDIVAWVVSEILGDVLHRGWQLPDRELIHVFQAIHAVYGHSWATRYRNELNAYWGKQTEVESIRLNLVARIAQQRNDYRVSRDRSPTLAYKIAEDAKALRGCASAEAEPAGE